jgi:hypothetical protein
MARGEKIDCIEAGERERERERESGANAAEFPRGVLRNFACIAKQETRQTGG